MSNMNSNRYNDDVLDLHVLLRDVLKIFKRAWWICVSAFVAVSVIFCAYQKYTYVPTYESKASFTVNTTTSYAEIAASTMIPPTPSRWLRFFPIFLKAPFSMRF